jgi:hypothetical protein
MVYSLIIKNNVVINRTIGTTILTDYPLPYDLILEDVNKNICIDSEYNPITGEFSFTGIPQEDLE